MKLFQDFLRQFPLYSDEVFEDILPDLSIVHLDAGAYFLRQGQTCTKIGFIAEGLVRVYYLNDGKEVTQCFCREQSITCAYSSMITQTPSDSAIQALEDTTLITLSYTSLQRLYQQRLFWQQIGRIAGEREFLVEQNHNRSMRDLSATDRYRYILEHDSELLQRVPLTYLASYMQVTPETLSRVRKKLSRN